MSTVYMCDNCGNIFSVNQSGWKEFVEQQSRSDQGNNSIFNNSHNHGAITRHIGPCCQLGRQNEVTPRVAMQELATGEIDTGYKRENREDMPGVKRSNRTIVNDREFMD